MNFVLLEKLALKETGRKRTYTRYLAVKGLVVYPRELALSDVLRERYPEKRSDQYFISYPVYNDNPFYRVFSYFLFIISLLRFSFVREIAVLICRSGQSRVYTLLALAFGRIYGKKIMLHDYRFEHLTEGEKKSNLHSLSRRIEFGTGISSIPKSLEDNIVSCRHEVIDESAFRGNIKKQAVPTVIVSGDFQKNRVVSLVFRTHELVKQKYPRTQFILVDMFPESMSAYVHYKNTHSFRFVSPQSFAELDEIYSGADMQVIATSRGLSQLFTRRAQASHYPIITNGFTLPGYLLPEEQYVASRDSYSELASRILTFVDCPEAYQGYMAP